MRGEARLRALDAVLDGGGVTAELLAEGDRRGVHEMGATRLHDLVEGLGLAGERHGEGRRSGHRGRRRSPRAAARWMALGNVSFEDCETFGSLLGRTSRPRLRAGEMGEHFVHVHVRRGAGAGLEDVDRELVGVTRPMPLRRLPPRVQRRRRRRSMPSSALTVAAAPLMSARAAISAGSTALARDREVLHRTLGLRAPFGARGDMDFAHGVVLDAETRHLAVGPSTLASTVIFNQGTRAARQVDSRTVNLESRLSDCCYGYMTHAREKSGEACATCGAR